MKKLFFIWVLLIGAMVSTPQVNAQSMISLKNYTVGEKGREIKYMETTYGGHNAMLNVQVLPDKRICRVDVYVSQLTYSDAKQLVESIKNRYDAHFILNRDNSTETAYLFQTVNGDNAYILIYGLDDNHGTLRFSVDFSVASITLFRKWSDLHDRKQLNDMNVGKAYTKKD